MVILTAFMIKIAAGALGISYSVWAAFQGLHALLPKGPQIIVEVIGADLHPGSSKHIDHHGWTKPDPKVIVQHGPSVRETHVEFNDLSPRFMFSTKVAYKPNQGFSFTVVDKDITSKDDFIGRCYVGAETVKKHMATRTPIVMSLGDGIGILKVRIKRPDQKITGTRSLEFIDEI